MTGTDRTGHCLCGSVRVHLTGTSSGFGACHCEMCRRWAGGPFLAVQAKTVSFDVDADALATFKSSDWAERGFCKVCGSVIFWRLTMPGPAQGDTHLSAGLLDDWSEMDLSTEVYIDMKPAAYAFAGDTHKMTEADIMAMVAVMQTTGDAQ